MPALLFEIVELPNGDVVLQRADEGEEQNNSPLVAIRFSAESLFFLKDSKFDVAKAMIEAGMDRAGELIEPQQEYKSRQLEQKDLYQKNQQLTDEAGEVDVELTDTPRVIH